MTPYEEGYEAYQNGASLQDCPYQADSPEAQLWEQGWEEGADQDYELFFLF